MSDGTGANFWHSEFVEAQARCKRLEGALNDIIETAQRLWMPVRCFRSEEQADRDDAKYEGVEMCADIARAALSDTAQQECCCENPDGEGVRHVSNECPIHNENPCVPIDPETGGE